MMEIKRIFPFLLIILIILMNSCGELPTKYLNKNISNLKNIKEIKGKLVLPENTSLNTKELKVSGINEAKINTVSYEFSVEVIDNISSQMLFLSNKDDELITGVFYFNEYRNHIVINDTTMGLFIPLFIMRTLDIQIDFSLVRIIKKHPDFNFLIYFIRNLLKNDPYNVINYDKHPRIFTTALKIVNDLISQNKRASFVLNEYNSAYIDCRENQISLINKKAIPYGICAYNMNKPANDIDSYNIDIKPKFIESHSILEILTGGRIDILKSERRYNLKNGKYLICLSKANFGMLRSIFLENEWWADIVLPITYLYQINENVKKIRKIFWNELNFRINEKNYIETIRLAASYRATIATTEEMILRSIPVLGDITLDIANEITNSDSLFNISTFLLKIIIEKKMPDNIIQLLNYLSESGKGNHIVRWYSLKTYLSILGIKLPAPRISILEKNMRSASKLLKETIKAINSLGQSIIFVYDLFFADQDIFFTVDNQQNPIQCIASRPPYPPSIELIPCKGFYKIGDKVKFRVHAYDPENDRVKYFFLKNGWNDYSETEFLANNSFYDFNYSFENVGDKKYNFYALDKNGAMSAATTIKLKVIPREDNFYENFSLYSLGLFNTNYIWNVEFKEPSLVKIDPNGYKTANSARFIDYDEDIGDSTGTYAEIYSLIEGNPEKIEFALKVETNEDDFGVRSWSEFGNWDLMAFYFIIKDGWMRYVKYGYNSDDNNDFVPIYKIKPDIWYPIKLIVNWNNESYDIYVNNNLVADNVRFVAYNKGYKLDKAPYFQVLAFIDSQCKSGYIDDIRMQGGSYKTLKKINLYTVRKSALKISE